MRPSGNPQFSAQPPARGPRGPCLRDKRRAAAFTLIELIIVIAITGIVAVMATAFFGYSVEGYAALARRAEMVDVAEMALRRMQKDIRRALPNSVRVRTNGSVEAIEMLTTVDGVSYRAGPQPPPPALDPDRWLEFDTTDTDFNILGHVRNVGTGVLPAGYRLAIYSTGAVDTSVIPPQPLDGANVYAGASLGVSPPAGSHIITPVGTAITVTAGISEDQVTLNPGHQFAFASPQQRVYVVDGPVTYLCDPTVGTQSITRYWGYTVASNQMTTDAALTAAGASSALLAAPVTACALTYSAGTLSRRGQVTADLTIQDPASSEQVRLLHQVHVDNMP